METTTATVKLYKGKQILSRTVYANGKKVCLTLLGAHPELGRVFTYDNGQSETIVGGLPVEG